MTDKQEPQTFEDKYGQSPLDLILKNPRVTPIFMFVLAVVPPLIAALIVAMVFLWN
ncbi:MAG: hypothetical protein ACREPR_20645 [Brasilonema sp.]